MSESNSALATPASNPEPHYALWADRALAALLDALLALLVCLAMYVLMFLVLLAVGGFGAAVSRGSEPNPALGLLSCGGCLMFLVLPPLSWLAVGVYNKVIRVGRCGASIGQEKLKLKVIGAEGLSVPTSRLFLRLLVQFAFCLIYILALLDLLWPLWDQQRQTLHDKAVGTYVIKVA